MTDVQGTRHLASTQDLAHTGPRHGLPASLIHTPTDFGWFSPTQARLAELHLRVPPGFRQVSP